MDIILILLKVVASVALGAFGLLVAVITPALKDKTSRWISGFWQLTSLLAIAAIWL